MGLKIVNTDCGSNIFINNKKIGYVEYAELFFYDRDGYAELVCNIRHNSEIEKHWKDWKRKLNSG